jgi:hypothetical protein
MALQSRELELWDDWFESVSTLFQCAYVSHVRMHYHTVLTKSVRCKYIHIIWFSEQGQFLLRKEKKCLPSMCLSSEV